MAHERDKLALKHLESMVADDIPGFKTKFKDQSKLHRGFGKLVKSWLRTATTLFPNVWFPNDKRHVEDPRAAIAVLQHEWVHLKDAFTLFDKLPRALKWLNVIGWYKLYLLPQLLAVFALVAPIAVLAGGSHVWWAFLAFALLAAPLPAYFRMRSEVRGYQRTRELGGNIDQITKAFTGTVYFRMWPFKKYIKKELAKPSPYRDEMDKTVSKAYELADAELGNV